MWVCGYVCVCLFACGWENDDADDDDDGDDADADDDDSGSSINCVWTAHDDTRAHYKLRMEHRARVCGFGCARTLHKFHSRKLAAPLSLCRQLSLLPRSSPTSDGVVGQGKAHT